MIVERRGVGEARLRRRLPALAQAAFTYPEVGSADAPQLPAGYRPSEDVRVVGEGAAAWRRLGDALLRWELHRASGMTVVGTADVVAPGVTVLDVAPYGPLVVGVPCRVVAVIDEERRRGFTYGTLPGNPVSGEERFTAELGDDGLVRMRLRSFSRPSGLAALVPPLARLGQRTANRRYLAAAERIARP